MDIFTLSMWVISGILLTVALIKDRRKTLNSAKSRENDEKHGRRDNW